MIKKANIKQQEIKDLVAIQSFFGRVFLILTLVILVDIPKPTLIQAVFTLVSFWAQQNRHPKN